MTVRREVPEVPAASTPWRRAEWAAAAAILLLAVFLRVSYFSERVAQPDFSHPIHDPLYFDSWGRTLAESITGRPMEKFSEINLNGPYGSPPGYPWFLCFVYLLSGGSYKFAVWVQILLGLASCVLAWRLARRLTGPAGGLFTLFGFSTYWIFVYYEQELQGWGLLVFCTVLLFTLIGAWARGVRPVVMGAAAGVVAGCMAMLRGEMMLAVPLVLAWWAVFVVWRAPSRWQSLAGAALFFLLAMLPVWAAGARNTRVTGESLSMSVNGVGNLYLANNLSTDGTFADQDLGSLLGLTEPANGYDLPKYLEAYRKTKGDARLGYGDLLNDVRDRFMGLLREHPGHIVRLFWRKARLFWSPWEVASNKEVWFDREFSPTLSRLPLFPFAAAPFLCGLGLLALRLRESLRARRMPSGGEALLLLFALHVLACFAVCVVFIMAARFRVPAIAAMFPVGALAVSEAARLVRARAWRPLGLLAGACLGLFLLLHIPLARYENQRHIWHTDRGLAYAGIGDAANAEAEYLEALKDDPVSPALVELAHLRAAAGRHAEAVEMYRRAMEGHAGDDGVWNGLGHSLLQLGRKEEARNVFAEAIRRFPLFTLPLNNLGNIYADEGKGAEAAECYLRALEIDPADRFALYNLGRLAALGGRWDGAREWFEKAVAAAPEYTEAQNYLGYALIRLGRPGDAVAPLEAAVRLDPAGTLQRVNLADALDLLGRHKEAAVHYLAAATVFEAAGERELALRQYRRVLERLPENAEARAGLGRLRGAP